MKTTLTFAADETSDSQELEIRLKANAILSVIVDIREYLRRKRKYEAKIDLAIEEIDHEIWTLIEGAEITNLVE